eukprot:4674999-Pleurochrysis_carterae.AAC.1
MSCRSTLASCSGDTTKWPFSSAVNARTVETVEAPVETDVGAAVAGVPLAGVERVVGPAAAVDAG